MHKTKNAPLTNVRGAENARFHPACAYTAPLMAAVTGGTRPGLLGKSRSAGGSETVVAGCRREAYSHGFPLWRSVDIRSRFRHYLIDYFIILGYDITIILPCQYPFLLRN